MATLTPRDNLNARVKGSSHIDFKTATTGVAAKSMRNEISHLVSTCDEQAKKVRSTFTTRVHRCLMDSRHLTPKCNHSSIYLLAIFQNAQKAWICVLFPFLLRRSYSTSYQGLGSYQVPRR
jgi:hypothetical protein